MSLRIAERGKQKRFQVGRRLGHGEMGVVYEAWDRKHERAVALKVYQRDDELTLARVRRILDRLRDLRHVNVVELVELIDAGEAPILVMERIDGEDVMSYCAGRWRSEPPGDGTAVVRCDVARLRSCLAQIASGLIALHRRGVVHKDLKPDNLRVTPDGRLVILDFSLSDDHGRASDAPGGTIAYMAPEQAIADGIVGPAADWYALGVIAYHALVGRLPFEGPPQRVLQDKAMREPPRVDELVTGAPADLVALCRTLLNPDPDRRPRDEEVTRLLGLAEPSAPVATAPTRPARQIRAIDRAIDGLREARASGRAAILAMVGEAGLGRSAVLAEVGRATRDIWPDAIVLTTGGAGDALDRIGETLAAAWIKLGDAEQAAIVPRYAGALVALLPALARVPALATAGGAAPARLEHLRATEAIDALRETLTLLSRRRPVVLLVDDLDQLDGDAARVFADGLRAPDPPPILMVGTCTDEAKLPPIERTSPVPLDWWSRKEIETLLAPQGLPAGISQAAVERSNGNPTLALELARSWSNGEIPADGDLAAILAARLATLSETARDLVVAIDLVQASVSAAALGAALDLDTPTVEAALDELTRAGLIATRVDARGLGLAPLRAAVRAALAGSGAAPRRTRLSRALAAALEDLTPSMQARLWHEAGDPAQTAIAAERAGAQARGQLRFIRATEHYRLAVEGGRHDLLLALAECAAAAGDGAAAARAFGRAAAHATGATRLALEVRAAEHHVLSGEVDQGITSFRGALGTIGIGLAHTPGAAIPRLLLRRGWLRLRGMRFARRTAADIAPQDLAGADACFSAAHHLGVLETVIGAELQARALAIALRLGDPEHLGHAAVLESIFLVTQGAIGRSLKLLTLARRIAEEIDSARLLSFTTLGAAGLEFFHRNRFDTALALFDTRNREILAEPEPETWALDMAQTYGCMTLANLGDIHELSRRVHRLIREAERRGDRYAATVYRMRTNIAWLARGDDAGADEAIATAERQWPYGGSYFRVPDYYRMYARTERALWGGDATTAATILAAELGPLQRSMLLRVHHVRAEVGSLACRVAIAAAPRGGARSAARRWLGQLGKTVVPEGPAWAALLAGCAAMRDGDRAGAGEPLQAAIARAEALSLGLLAASARIRLGEARGNEYSDNAARGLHDLARLGVTDVPRMLAMTAPI